MAVETVHIATVGEFWGHWQSGYEVTLDDLQRMVTNFRPPMVIDYEHQSILGDGKAPAAGWVNEIWVDGDNLYGSVEWTENAEEMIDVDEYRFLSPVFDFDATDPETGNPIGAELVNVALTNMPFIEGMEPVTVTENSAIGRLPGVNRQHVLNSKQQLPTAGGDERHSESNDTDSAMDWQERWKSFLNRLGSILNSANSDELEALDEVRQLKQKAKRADDLEEENERLNDRVSELEDKLYAQEEQAKKAEQEADEELLDEAVANYKIQKSARDEWEERLNSNREAARMALNSIPEGAVKPGSDGPDEPENDSTSTVSTSGSKLFNYVQDQTQ